MQTIFRKAVVAVLVTGVLGPATVSAHPGHSPLDLSAQVAAPFSGPDHLLAFLALSTSLLFLARLLRKASVGEKAAAVRIKS